MASVKLEFLGMIKSMLQLIMHDVMSRVVNSLTVRQSSSETFQIDKVINIKD